MAQPSARMPPLSELRRDARGHVCVGRARPGYTPPLTWGLATWPAVWPGPLTLSESALVAGTPDGFCALSLAGSEGLAEFVERLCRRWPTANPQRDDTWADQGLSEIAAGLFVAPQTTSGMACGGVCAAMSRWAPCRLHVRGTGFEVAVWNALLETQVGQTLSYGDLAARVGRDRSSARAIGGAVGANPVAVLIPCHRVCRRDGQLGGYRWGPAYKTALLQYEGGGPSHELGRSRLGCGAGGAPTVRDGHPVTLMSAPVWGSGGRVRQP